MVYTGIYCTECTNSLIMFLTRKAMSQFNFFEILMNRRWLGIRHYLVLHSRFCFSAVIKAISEHLSCSNIFSVLPKIMFTNNSKTFIGDVPNPRKKWWIFCEIWLTNSLPLTFLADPKFPSHYCGICNLSKVHTVRTSFRCIVKVRKQVALYIFLFSFPVNRTKTSPKVS